MQSFCGIRAKSWIMAHSSISCGRDLSSVTDLANVLEQCGEKGYVKKCYSEFIYW